MLGYYPYHNQHVSYSVLSWKSRMDIDGTGSYNNNNNTQHLDEPFTKVPWRLQRIQKYNQKQHNQNR